MPSLSSQLCLVLVALLLLHAAPATAFGAGNIASISKIEGHNWRHGDIEDMLKHVAFIKGHKWTSMMVKRVYFGNWLRDYSQAMDVGSLKGVQAGTIRILVWVLSFLSFGYATAEFEVTEERLGVYRPEEHIDNPKDYADNVDARQFDSRLRPPVQPIELQVDLETGMKNYIANESLGIATSAGYVKHSFTRSIHFGRVYTNGAFGFKGKEKDLCEALRCLGQGLHCLEDFGAHTNYVELALIEMGFKNIFPHVGIRAVFDLSGGRRQKYPLITGTFGVVDFLHSVRLGEATDHFAQTEVEELDLALKDAEGQSSASDDGSREFGTSPKLSTIKSLLARVPGAGDLVQQAGHLQTQSDVQQELNRSQLEDDINSRAPKSESGPPGSNVPGTSMDPVKLSSQIYPILEFRDTVVKLVANTIEKIPGLEALVEKINDMLTLFVLSLLAPFVRPVINAVSTQLKAGSHGVVDASGKQQYEPWTDPFCSDPTHSILSKDHFSNILNEPAGQVASVILQYVAPRVIYAWEHPEIPLEQVLEDVLRVFHHPALRDHNCKLHQNMYDTVGQWATSRPPDAASLSGILGSDSVRHGKNHTKDKPSDLSFSSVGQYFSSGSHSKVRASPWEHVSKARAPEGEEIAAKFPGTETAFDSTRPPPSPIFGYSAQPTTQAQPQQLYEQPTYPPSSQYGQQPFAPSSLPPFGQPQWQSGYEDLPGGPDPTHGGYLPQPPANQFGYVAIPQHEYKPNEPALGKPYGYNDPPPQY